MAVDWTRARALFEESLELDAGARRDFLRSSCSDDAALLAEVESLLTAHESAGAFLDTPYVDLRGSGEGASREAAAFPDCGRYRLVSVLGRGGMGTVYRALRDDAEYEQEVCVKVLRRDLATEDLARRFRGERQILARLEHPNIAQLLDGGTTADGRPFLVMELVDGSSIDRYCREHALSIRQRLELLVKLCRAVHVAHQSLVVHRDLKPPNILVTDEGEPKLLDFGVAKLLETEDFPQTVVETAPGQRPLTPRYASPEQVKGTAITTASDVYALGVIAFELLTESSPYHRDESSPAELARAICEHSPETPSSALLARGGEKGATRRRAKELRGDLDTVLLKALAKEPDRRYASAQALAEDLKRYLTGRPVRARPDSWSYRTGKLIRRNRVAVSVAAVALVLLLSSLVGLLVQRQRILDESLLATSAKSFLIDLFSVADPDRSRGEQVTAREVMARGASEIDRRLGDQPALAAELKETVAEVYLQLGLYGEAEPLIDEALELRRHQGRSGEAGLARSLLLSGRLARDQGRLDQAERELRQAAELLDRRAGSETPDRVEARLGLAQTLLKRGELEESERQFGIAVDLASRLPPADVHWLALALNRHAQLQRVRGDHAAAEQSYERSIEIYRRVYGDDHPQVIGLLNNMALLDQAEGQWERAEERFREAIRKQRQLYGGAHPALSNTLDNLASLLYDRGHYAESESVCREALEIRQQVLEPGHPKRAASQNLLGLILRDQGKLEAAEEPLRRALESWSDLHGEAHELVANGCINVGDLLFEQRRLDEAASFYRRALEVQDRLGRAEAAAGARLQGRLGRLERVRGDFERALGHYRRALEIYEHLDSPNPNEVATTRHNLGVLLDKTGDHQGAETLFRQTLEVFRAQLGSEHPNVGVVEKNLAGALNGQGRFEEAEQILAHALQTFEGNLQPSHRWVLGARVAMAASLVGRQRYELAEEQLLAVWATAVTEHGETEGPAIDAADKLATLYERWGQTGRMATWRRRAAAGSDG